MSIETYLARVEGGLEKKAKSLWTAMTAYAGEGFAILKNFFTVLVPEEVAAITPYAEEALGEAADALPTLIAGLVAGSPIAGLTAYATAVVPVIISTAQKAEAAGLNVAGAAISTAVHAAIANAASAQAIWAVDVAQQAAPQTQAPTAGGGVEANTPQSQTA